MGEQLRTALFIDGTNLVMSTKSLGFTIDFRRLLKEFQSRGQLIRAYYYTVLAEEKTDNSLRPLVDWLEYNGYFVVTKPTKEFVDSSGMRKRKVNMNVELAVGVMEMAKHLDHVFLFSGRGEFRAVIEAVQRKGVRVSVVSTGVTKPPMVADELRRQADEFIDLTDLAPNVGHAIIAEDSRK